MSSLIICQLPSFGTIANQAQKQRLIANLYHAAVDLVLTCQQRHCHQIHPILAAFVGEQMLVTPGFNGNCPCYPEDRKRLGEYVFEQLDPLHNPGPVLREFLQ